ncbi:MAG: rod shape-determining protein RodA [Chloroflexi bacterium]|nr:rod shape-determining protein RodA [Chloroflexota bacterium]
MRDHWVGIRWRQVDPVLIAAAVSLTFYGIVLVTSATWQYIDQPSLLTNTWFLKQVGFAIVGILLMVACASVHPRVVSTFAYIFYAGSLLALATVLVLGHGSADYGAQRWIEVAGIPLQPSEPAKLAVILVLARILSLGPLDLKLLLVSAATTIAPVMLIYAQPDLGTALSLAVIWVGMIVLGGASARLLATLGVGALVVTPLAWLGLKDYMRDRILIFLDPSADALGQGYNILQAQISIGSGGMFGKGLFEGTQTQLRYLRVSHSDFIFSVLGEEMGFVGALLLFALLATLLFRLLRAFDTADDRFGALLCAGAVSMIGFQAIANLGANVGLIPVVGIPLPFVSYGGSALVTQLAALGLVQATLIRRRMYQFEA